MISFEDFNKVDPRSETIKKVEKLPRTHKPAFKVWVNFGPGIGSLQTSAQITVHYTSETLVGKQVIGYVNSEEKNRAGGFVSQFLLVGFKDENNAICLATIDKKVINGEKMF